MDRKMKDIGWMYHMGAKPCHKEDEPKAYPPPSQIPVLNGEDPTIYSEDSQLKRGWIKDTDTKYIILAKKGGREDLLRFRENPPRSKEAKSYPRCEWFYIEDNMLEDEARNPRPEEPVPYVPQLPEYMVHKPNEEVTEKGDYCDGSAHYRPSRLPYAVDRTSVYEREGRSATDKTVRIPEQKKIGYGVRNEHSKDKPEKKVRIPMPERGKAPVSENAPKPRETMPVDNEDNPTDMTKLLAGEYQREWRTKCNKWHDDQERMKPKYDPIKKAEALPPSVYQDTFNSPPQKRQIKHGRRATPELNKTKEDRAMDGEIQKMEKELFKLSKFKNIGSRIDCKREKQPINTEVAC